MTEDNKDNKIVINNHEYILNYDENNKPTLSTYNSKHNILVTAYFQDEESKDVEKIKNIMKKNYISRVMSQL